MKKIKHLLFLFLLLTGVGNLVNAQTSVGLALEITGVTYELNGDSYDGVSCLPYDLDKSTLKATFTAVITQPLLMQGNPVEGVLTIGLTITPTWDYGDLGIGIPYASESSAEMDPILLDAAGSYVNTPFEFSTDIDIAGGLGVVSTGRWYLNLGLSSSAETVSVGLLPVPVNPPRFDYQTISSIVIAFTPSPFTLTGTPESSMCVGSTVDGVTIVPDPVLDAAHTLYSVTVSGNNLSDHSDGTIFRTSAGAISLGTVKYDDLGSAGSQTTTISVKAYHVNMDGTVCEGETETFDIVVNPTPSSLTPRTWDNICTTSDFEFYIENSNTSKYYFAADPTLPHPLAGLVGNGQFLEDDGGIYVEADPSGTTVVIFPVGTLPDDETTVLGITPVYVNPDDLVECPGGLKRWTFKTKSVPTPRYYNGTLNASGNIADGGLIVDGESFIVCSPALFNLAAAFPVSVPANPPYADRPTKYLIEASGDTEQLGIDWTDGKKEVNSVVIPIVNLNTGALYLPISINNSGVLPGTVEFTVTPYRNDCAGDPFSFSVIANPIAKIDLITESGQTICPTDNDANTEGDFTFSYEVTGATTTWVRDPLVGGPSLDGLSYEGGFYINLEDGSAYSDAGFTTPYVNDAVTITVTPEGDPAVDNKYRIDITTVEDSLKANTATAYIVRAQYGDCPVISDYKRFEVTISPSLDVPNFDIQGKVLRYKNGDMVNDIWLTPYRLEGTSWEVRWMRMDYSDKVSGPTDTRDEGINVIPRFWAVNETDNILRGVFKFYVVDVETGCVFYTSDEDALIIEVEPYVVEDTRLSMQEVGDIDACIDASTPEILFQAIYDFEGVVDEIKQLPFDKIRYDWKLVEGTDVLGLGLEGVLTSDEGETSVQFVAAGGNYATSGTALYYVTPRWLNSAGKSMYFRVTVTEPGEITILATERGTAPVYNAGDAVVIDLQGTADLYKWTASGDAIGVVEGMGTRIPAFLAKEGTTTITVTPVSSIGCEGEAKEITIVVNPQPEIRFTISDASFCSDEDISLSIDAFDTDDYTYKLTFVSGTDLGLSVGVDAITGNYKNEAGAPVVGRYSLVLIDNLTNEESNAITFDVTIDAEPAIVTPDDIVATNGTLIPAFTFVGNVSNGAYSWKKIDGTTIANLSTQGEGNVFPSFTAVNTGTETITATYEVTATSGVCGEAKGTFTITVHPSAIISDQIADVTVCNGGDFNQAITKGENTRYTLDLIGGVDLGLAFNVDTTEIVKVGLANATKAPVSGTYRLTAYNTVTGIEGQSEEFVVKVLPAANVNAVDDIIAVDGLSVPAILFSGNAQGGTYTWEWVEEAGSVRLPNMNSTGEGNIFPSFKAENNTEGPLVSKIKVTPYSGAETEDSCPGEPIEFTITVYPAPVIPQEIADTTICSGGNFELTIAAQENVKYTNKLIGGVDLGITATSNADGSLTIAGSEIKNETPSIIFGTYQVTAINTVTGIVGKSEVYTIYVNPAPTVNKIATIYTVNGKDVESITFTGAATSYAWTVSGDSIGNAQGGGLNIIPAFTAYNPSKAIQSAVYSVTPTFGVCEGAAVDSVVVIKVLPNTIEDIDLVATEIADQVICSGASTTAIAFVSTHLTGEANGFKPEDVTYAAQLIEGSDLLTLNDEGTGYNATLLKNETGITTPISGTYLVTPYWNNNQGVPTIFTVTVKPAPTVNKVDPIFVYNNEVVPVIHLTGVGTTFSWTASGENVGNAQGTGADVIPSFIARNTTSEPLVAAYSVVASYEGCAITVIDSVVVINVLPNTIEDIDLIAASIEDQTVCSAGAIAAIDFNSVYRFADRGFDESKVTYELKKVGGVDVLSAAAITNDGVSGSVIANPTNQPIYGAYEVTPVWNNKEGVPALFTIRVLPGASIGIVADQVLCNNSSTASVVFEGYTPATQYTWAVISNEGVSQIGLPVTSGIGNMPSYLVNNGGTAQATDVIEVTSTYQMTDGSGVFCAGGTTTFAIKVNPTVKVETISSRTVNPGDQVTIDIRTTATDGVTSYKWTNSNQHIGLFEAEGTTNRIQFVAINESNERQVSTITVYPYYTNDGRTCEGEPMTFTVTVNTAPIISPIEDVVVCNGKSVPFIDLQAKVADAVYFTWTSSVKTIGLADNTDPAARKTHIPTFDAIYDESIGNGNDMIVNTVTVTPFVTSNGVISEGAPFSFTISVKPTTKIRIQPASSGAVCETQSIGLSVAATGYNLKYQWYRNGSVIGRSENESAITANLVIDEANISDAGTYFVLVTGECEDLESAKVTVEVNLNPSLIVQKWNDVLMVNADANTNGGYNFTSYQWFKNGNRLAGEVMPNYHETSVNTNDVYQVVLGTSSGTFMSCPTRLLVFDSQIMLSVYPNPVYAGEVVTVEANLPSTANLNTLKLQVINASGNVHSITVGTGRLTQVAMPTTPGVYVLRAIYEDSNQGSVLKEFKIIVK